MILSAHQPAYFPWLGLFHKVALCDEWCIFDDVQMERRSFTARCDIKTADGPVRLTVPVEMQGHMTRRLWEMRICGAAWRRKHRRTIELAYRRAPYFDWAMPGIDRILTGRQTHLVDLCRDTFDWALELLGIAPARIWVASTLSLHRQKSALVLEMCQRLNANRYIFGEMGAEYADAYLFRRHGIGVHFQQYQHPVYAQQHGAEFMPRCSIIDLLMNCGPDSKAVLMSGNLLELPRHAIA